MVLTLPDTRDTTTITVETTDKPIDKLLGKEWLLTNERGGYSSSTIVGCNTRRYHGLLVGSLNPPGGRIVGLAHCLEMIICSSRIQGADRVGHSNAARVYELSTFEFDDRFAPEGFRMASGFRQDTGVHFDYKTEHFCLTKSVYLLRNSDTVGLVYQFKEVAEPLEFVLRPFVALRDFHTLQKSYARLCCASEGAGLLVRHDSPGSCELFLSCQFAEFERDPQWWFNFLYRRDRERGQEFLEDLWAPGFFKYRIEGRTEVVMWANLSNRFNPKEVTNLDIQTVRKELQDHRRQLLAAAKTRDRNLQLLSLAADSFVAKRRVYLNEGAEPEKPSNSEASDTTTIVAGFPWFTDWGRDAFISLPGLLLSAGRFQEAAGVLTTFAAAAEDGVIPNCFDDYGGTACFNSIDASLWFIHAAFQYLNSSGDAETFRRDLLPTIHSIVQSYYGGTRFDIHADVDGLITGGDQNTQLTWMDAKCEGVAFTPRYGKAVEVNALWYNAICNLSAYYSDRDTDAAAHYHQLADRVEASFQRLFWNEQAGYLNDCVLPDGSVDTSLRPNQIFAVSLPFSPLSEAQQRRVVEVVQERLLTPYGLRTLDRNDPNYKGTYNGPQRQRDEAYHQGTVWPYLIGAFVESYLKVHGSNKQSRRKATEFIRPLLDHLTSDGCLGQICEVFDGDSPGRPKGCIAQAWSVAELIRAYRLVNG